MQLHTRLPFDQWCLSRSERTPDERGQEEDDRSEEMQSRVRHTLRLSSTI